jgi:hypothetical protein
VRQLEGEAVLLDLTTGRYFGLNATGGRIWALLGEGLTLAGIGERLAEEYALSPQAIAGDIDALCTAIEGARLADRIG